MNTLNQPRSFFALTLCALAVLSMLIWYAVVGPRGSDQYWYVADTETLLAGREALTNTVFAGDILRQQTGNPVTPIAHNGPLLHINAFLAQLVNVVEAWKLTNLLFLWVGAIATGAVVARLIGYGAGLAALVCYAFAPLAVWQTGNFLQEIYLGALAAVILAVFVVLQKGSAQVSYWIMPPVLFLACLSHPMFMIIGVLSVIGFAIKKFWFVSVATLIAIVLANFFKDAWFPSSFQPNLSAIISSTVPGGSNMHWHHTDVQPVISIEFLWKKLLNALYVQFGVLRNLPFTMITNVGILAWAYLLVFHRARYGLFLLSVFFAYGLYFAMIVLLQNQVRYQIIIAPATVSCLIVALHHLLQGRMLRVSIVAGAMAFLAIDATIVKKLHDDTRREKAALQIMQPRLDELSESARIAMVDSFPGQKLSVITQLRPRKTLMINTGILEHEKIQRVLELFEADLIISDRPDGETEFNWTKIDEFSITGFPETFYWYEPRS